MNTDDNSSFTEIFENSHNFTSFYLPLTPLKGGSLTSGMVPGVIEMMTGVRLKAARGANLALFVCLILYLCGPLFITDFEQLLGFDTYSLRSVVRRLAKRGDIRLIENNRFVSGRSSKLIALSRRCRFLELFSSSRLYCPYSIPTVENLSERMIPHTYGISLTALQLRLITLQSTDISISRYAHEISFSFLGESIKKGANITSDSLYILKTADTKHKIIIEFDTCKESLKTLCSKFKYFEHSVFNSSDEAINNDLILFSINDISVKTDRFANYPSKDQIIRVYIKILAALCLKNGTPYIFSSLMETKLRFLKDFGNPDVINQYLTRITKEESLDSGFRKELIGELAKESSSLSYSGKIENILYDDDFRINDIASLYELLGKKSLYSSTLSQIRSFILYCPDYDGISRSVYNSTQYKTSIKRSIDFARFVGTSLLCYDTSVNESVKLHHYFRPVMDGFRIFFLPSRLISGFKNHLLFNSSVYIMRLQAIYEAMFQQYDHAVYKAYHRVGSPSRYLTLKDCFVSDSAVVQFVVGCFDASALVRVFLLCRSYVNISFPVKIIMLPFTEYESGYLKHKFFNEKNFPDGFGSVEIKFSRIDPDFMI